MTNNREGKKDDDEYETSTTDEYGEYTGQYGSTELTSRN